MCGDTPIHLTSNILLQIYQKIENFSLLKFHLKKKKKGKICTQGKSKFNPKICTEKSGRPTMHMVKNLGIYKYAFIKQNS